MGGSPHPARGLRAQMACTYRSASNLRDSQTHPASGSRHALTRWSLCGLAGWCRCGLSHRAHVPAPSYRRLRAQHSRFDVLQIMQPRRKIRRGPASPRNCLPAPRRVVCHLQRAGRPRTCGDAASGPQHVECTGFCRCEPDECGGTCEATCCKLIFDRSPPACTVDQWDCSYRQTFAERSSCIAGRRHHVPVCAPTRAHAPPSGAACVRAPVRSSPAPPAGVCACEAGFCGMGVSENGTLVCEEGAGAPCIPCPLGTYKVGASPPLPLSETQCMKRMVEVKSPTERPARPPRGA